MGTFTAHISIGWPNEGGMIPTHVAWLWENSRPAWLLEPTKRRLTGTLDDRPGSQEEIRWIPEGPEHILEDGLLLMAMHALGDKAVLELAHELLPELLDADTSGLQKDADAFCDLHLLSADNPKAGSALTQLRERCSQTSWNKLVVTVLERSSLERQLPILERYRMELEVCTVSYSRLWPEGASDGVDKESPIVRGSLEPRPDAPGNRYTEIRL